MRAIKLRRRIFLLSKEVRSLKIQLRFVTKRASYLLDYIRSKEPNFDIDQHVDPKSDNIKTNNSFNFTQRSPIIDDLDHNLIVKCPNNRNYSDETKFFCYTIYSISSSAYRVVRSELPFPSEQRLRKIFSPYVQKVEKQLTDINSIEQILNERGSLFGQNVIKCTLSVDAFSINTLDDNDNYSFLYLILPFDTNIRPFPLHLETKETGNANSNSFNKIKFIIEKSKNTKFKIILVSVDGDRYYDPLFSIAFNFLKEKFFKNVNSINLQSVFEFFETFSDVYMNSDPLHIFKNFRSKLLTDLTVVNPQTKNSPINSEAIEDNLHLGSALTDRGSLAKLHDCYPINIFTIGNSIKIFYKSNPETFFFFIVLSFWNELLLNTNLSLYTRQYFLETIILIFIKFYSFFENNKIPETIALKKCSDGRSVLWISHAKAIRIINTLFVQYYAISLKSLNDFLTAFDRFCSHPTENFIGLIRMLCDYDNPFKTILHNLSRYEYVNRVAKNIYVKKQPKRLNLGGVPLIEKEVKFSFDHSAFELCELLFSYMDEKFDENLMKELILSLELLNGNAPFRTKNVPNRTSGGQIMLKLVSISQYKRKIWSNQEIHFIDNSLWLKKDILNDEYCAKFNCSKDELNKIIQERYIEISKRE